jgi:hypothetical protein
MSIAESFFALIRIIEIGPPLTKRLLSHHPPYGSVVGGSVVIVTSVLYPESVVQEKQVL